MLSLYYNYAAKQHLKEIMKSIEVMEPDVPVSLLAQRDMLLYEIQHHNQSQNKELVFLAVAVCIMGSFVYYVFKYRIPYVY